MVAAAVAGSTGQYPASTGGSAPASGGSVPFFYGSNWYCEKITTDTFLLTTTAQEFVRNVTPGGFLRGVRLQIRTSTVAAGGTAAADNPWNVLQSTTLENIDGAPIKYPMGGFSDYVAQTYYRPWWGDAATRYDFTQGINPSFSLFLAPEICNTAGVLANTDARAQYRYRFTLNTAANVVTAGSTAPTITVTQFLETWAQPDREDLHKNPVEGIPPGLALQTLRRSQTLTLNNASADNTFQLANTGNELRGYIILLRDSNNARQDFLSDPIRIRLDNRAIATYSPDEVFQQMADHYPFLAAGTTVRPTGVYVWPRFKPSQSWMATTNATYLIIQSATLGTATNMPGTAQIITDEVVPVDTVPADMESI